MQNIVEVLGDKFNIPIINDNRQTWFIRTESGSYYDDFRLNEFVAIGWDNIPAAMVQDNKKTEADLRDEIVSYYPDSKRPGLIYGQLDSFYNKMRKGDWIVIPSEGTKKITIGVLEDVVKPEEEFSRKVTENIKICPYSHIRRAKWRAEISSSYDIYLNKSLRAQQTISNISDIAPLVFRHLYPAYITDEDVHVTFQKTTDSALSAKGNMELISSIIGIADEVADLYGVNKFDDDIKLKTAVGSPGIIEVIMPLRSVAPVVVGSILSWLLVGSFNGKTGKTTGLATIFEIVNTALNDHQERKLKAAETRLKDAEVNRTNAETLKIEAETEKLKAETAQLYIQQEDFLTERDGQLAMKKSLTLEEMKLPTLDNVSKCIQSVAEECDKCEAAIEKNGIQQGK